MISKFLWLVGCPWLFIHLNQAQSGIEYLGTYSNMVTDEEHAVGSSVNLWRQAGEVFGHFLHSEGLVGDTPTGLIQEVSFDSVSGALSFSAVVYAGRHFCRIHTNVASNERFMFKGALSRDQLKGSLARSVLLHPENQPSREKVELKRNDDWYFGPDRFANRKEWEEYSRGVLRRRGPVRNEKGNERADD